MKIVGIDPGLRVTGYACVERSPARRAERPSRFAADVRLVEAGVFRFKAGKSVAQRLEELETDLTEVLGRVKPQAVAVEKLYAHYKHPTTAIIMGHARGVVLLVIQRAGLQLVELSATEVKKSLTGNGHASKSQMQDGVRMHLALAARPEPADVADAIAIACCAHRRLT